MVESHPMDDLFDHAMQQRMKSEAPLAARMRPRTLAEYIGQEHIVGPGKLLRRAIEADRLFSSILLWGPPGTGKTTLAQVIANTTRSHFETISAILAGKAELRQVIGAALERRRLHGERTILFVDEVHRWNKAQQDALLPHVENGTVTLIGATTENPFFEVIGALDLPIPGVSVAQSQPRRDRDPAGPRSGRPGAGLRATTGQSSIRTPVHISLRLPAATFAMPSTPSSWPSSRRRSRPTGRSISRWTWHRNPSNSRAVLYDKDGDSHYDTISAFIKSVRGSDPDAALYWLAKMIYAGEDPRFILRRLIVLAGEDIGLADPMGIVVASAAAHAFDYIGLPEGVYPLVEATLYLSTAPKSNSAGGYFKAMQKLEQEGQVSVPRHLMDSNS